MTGSEAGVHGAPYLCAWRSPCIPRRAGAEPAGSSGRPRRRARRCPRCGCPRTWRPPPAARPARRSPEGRSRNSGGSRCWTSRLAQWQREGDSCQVPVPPTSSPWLCSAATSSPARGSSPPDEPPTRRASSPAAACSSSPPPHQQSATNQFRGHPKKDSGEFKQPINTPTLNMSLAASRK